jgi:Integrase core domain
MAAQRLLGFGAVCRAGVVRHTHDMTRGSNGLLCRKPPMLSELLACLLWAMQRLARHLGHTTRHCPCQSGRIERLFLTLKEKLDRIEVESFAALNAALGEFRFFYNFVRPHRHLRGWTPAEAWAGIDPFRQAAKREFWFEAWEGLLCGYYLRR